MTDNYFNPRNNLRKFWLHFFICCPDCPINTFQMGQETCAIYTATNKYSQSTQEDKSAVRRQKGLSIYLKQYAVKTIFTSKLMKDDDYV